MPSYRLPVLPHANLWSNFQRRNEVIPLLQETFRTLHMRLHRSQLRAPILTYASYLVETPNRVI